MPTNVAGTNRVLISERDARLASGVMDVLDGPEGFLSVADGAHTEQPLPPEIGALLQHVLATIARGGSVTVTTTPDELTTSAAAAMLGISRPTLMKLLAAQSIPSHKVGSHTRLRTEDVLSALRARRERERASFAELRALEDELLGSDDDGRAD